MLRTLPQLDTQEAYFSGGDSVSLFRRSIVPTGEVWARLGLLHGYGDHCGRYRAFMEWLAERGVACHALDFRGNGRSEGRRGYAEKWTDYNADALAFLKLEAVQGHAEKPLFLLGHSNGGLVLASTLLRSRPAEIAGCIFSAPYFAVKLPVPFHLRLLAQIGNVLFPHLLVKSKFSEDWLTSDPEMQREDAADTLNFSGATPRWYLASLAEQRALLPRAAEWDYPTLLLTGGADPLVRNEVAETFVQQSAAESKTVREYPGLKHEILREIGRDAIYNAILHWLQAQTETRQEDYDTAAR